MHKPLIQLVISLLAALLPVAATAAEPFTFEGLTYTPIDTKNCSVKAADKSIISGDIKIPSSLVSPAGTAYTVTTIGKNAFNGCTSLALVTIPESVTNIGELAFGECLGLKSVTIREGVTSIDGGAFINCSSLASVVIPASAKIGSMAFKGCGTQAQDPVQVVMLSETPISNIGEIGLPTGATVYVANAEAVSAYTAKLGDAVAAIEPVLAVTAEPEKEYYKASEEMVAPAVVIFGI